MVTSKGEVKYASSLRIHKCLVYRQRHVLLRAGESLHNTEVRIAWKRPGALNDYVFS